MAMSWRTDDFHLPPAGTPALDVPLNADGTSTAMLVTDTSNKTVQIGGTFVATVQLQGTINGTDWVNIGAAVTAAAIIEITPAYRSLRVVITGYASGTVVASFAGFNTRVAN